MNISPEPDEIVQHDPDGGSLHPIDVTVTGPVNTRDLPAAGYPGYKTVTNVGASVGVQLLAGPEPRRQGAVIYCLTSDLWISTSQAGAQSGSSGAMRIAAAIPYPVRHIHEVWACTVSGTADVGVETTNWTE